MLFSIVIPVYNVAAYLTKCVESVLANDLSDAEVILVDDGSTDGKSGALCDELALRAPEKIRVIHQENRGLGGARNTGIEAAAGEYLFFLDSDDYIAPGSLKCLSGAIAGAGADIVSFPCIIDNGEGKLTRTETSGVYEKPFSLKERPEFLFSLPSAAVRCWRRALFTETGIRFPSRVWYEDIRTTTKLFAKARSIATVTEPLYYYLVREGSITRNTDVGRNREILDAFDDILGWYAAEKLDTVYHAELEKLAVDHLLLAGTVRVARIDPKSPLLKEFRGYLDEKFPAWKKNKYLPALPKGKKLALTLAKGKHYRLLKLAFSIKG